MKLSPFLKLKSGLFFPVFLVVGIMSHASALSLGEGQKRLFKLNPDLRIAELERDKAKLQLRGATAQWHPTLDAFASYGYTSERTTIRLDLPSSLPPSTQSQTQGLVIERPIGDHDRAELGLDLIYPLFTAFSRIHAIRAMEKAVGAQEARLHAIKNGLSFRLASLYLALELAFKQAEYSEKLIAFAGEHLERAQALSAAGMAVRSIHLAAEARARQSEVDAMSYRNVRDSLELELAEMLEMPDARLEPEPWNWNTLDSADGDVKPAPLAERPEMEILQLSLEQAMHSRKVLEGRKWPNLSAMAGYRYADPGLNMPGDGFMGYGLVGVQMKWNLYDGFKNHWEREQLRRQEEILTLEKKKLSDEWRKTLNMAVLQIEKWRLQRLAAQAALEAARALEADMKLQFENGLATSLDWLEAKNDLAKAELGVEQARILGQLAQVRKRFAAGEELRF